MKPILLTGGTGTLGGYVLRRLTDAGLRVRVLTRRARTPVDGVTFVEGDLLNATGANHAVDGVDTIIHCAGQRKGDEILTRNLIQSAVHAGRPHIINISVVGADRVPVAGPLDRLMFGYFEMKRNVEQIVSGSGLPWTTLRSTQFYDSLLPFVRIAAKLPVVLTPAGFCLQPVDTDEVAALLVALSQSEPSGLVDDVAGPRVYTMDDFIRSYLTHMDRRRLFISVGFPGKAFQSIREGANLAPDRAVGVRSWEQFVCDRIS